MRSRLFLLLLLITGLAQSIVCFGQSEGILIRFIPLLNNAPLQIRESAGDINKDSLLITTFRCYISNISLWQDKKLVWEERKSYHLLDAENPESLAFRIEAPTGRYNSLHLSLGIDSATSCSGVHGGELDPVKGMYWAWQSGYINFKVEGISPMSTSRKHQFQFHLGGYQYPFLAMQPVELNVIPGKEIAVAVDLGAFLSGIDLSNQNSVMIPGKEAVLLSQKAIRIFHTAN